MTVTVEQYIGNGYYVLNDIVLLHNGTNVYVVQICPVIDGNLYGYPMLECRYTDRKKAHATYLRYIRKYCK